VRFEYKHERTYLATADTVTLQVALSNAGGKLECLIAERFPDAADHFDLLASSLNQRPINLNAPLALNPVYIPKPWGQEIWFSGIEERGVSSCQGVPISWLLDLFGRHLGCNGAPLLLKILDPLPEENIGDLYFELHKKKVEVYVVTHVDSDAWPDGVGRIRYGFDQSLLARYESQFDFLADYRQAVGDYEQVRRAIDSGKPGLDREEITLRQAMYRFTALKDIRKGDVIRVAPFVPHSLQHGVRVVEFQTPHHERYVISFGQKVVTQENWDTKAALKVAKLDPEPFSPGEIGDSIADFDEFTVQRITVEPGQTKQLDGGQYQILIGFSGSLICEPNALLT
ncbi:uncharacterized protein METZ01_LOCUS329599, partial [marine metagenome]